MKNIELMKILHENIIKMNSADNSRISIQEFIDKVLKDNPTAIVAISNGECERPGEYAPEKKEGGIDLVRRRLFHEGEAFPDGENWIQVSYISVKKPRL